MKKLLFLIIPLLFLILMTLPAFAWEASVTGVEVTIQYTEPSTNKTGTPLTDLSYIIPSYDIGQGWVVAGEIPATSSIGGKKVTGVVTVPVLVDTEVNVNLKLNAVDTSGNKSGDSTIKVVRVDRLSPAPPQ